MLLGPKNIFGPDPNPKNSPKQAQNEVELKTKR